MEIIEVVKQGIDETINAHYKITDEQKYSEKECAYIKSIIYEGNYDILTRANNARKNIREIGSEAIMVDLIRGAYLSYTIETLRGDARQMGLSSSNGYPVTPAQAVNFIYEQLNSCESPSQIYSYLWQNKAITDLLISNYVILARSSTKEERDYAHARCPQNLVHKLETLDNLQLYLLNSRGENQISPSGNQIK